MSVRTASEPSSCSRTPTSPFDDRILHTRMEVDAFQDEHGVDTTPQVFIDGERIGGSDELERYLESAASDA